MNKGLPKSTIRELLQGILVIVGSLCVSSQSHANPALPLQFQQASSVTGPVVVDPWIYAGTMAADLNRDGKSDLIEFSLPPGSPTNLWTMRVLLNAGDGNFILNQEFRDPDPYPYFTGSKIVDLNGDQILDVVLRVSGPNDFFGAMYGKGDGTFQPLTIFHGNPVDYEYTVWLQVGDFNRDGKMDVVGIRRPGIIVYQTMEVLVVFLNNGNGGFLQQNYLIDQGASGFPRFFEKGDFNGDSKLDLLIANEDYDGIKILLGNGNGSFQIGTNSLNTSFSEIFTVDVNADGKTDILIVDYNVIGVYLANGNGDGTFLPEIQNYIPIHPLGGMFPRSGDGTDLSLADFNGDGLVDVAYKDAGPLHSDGDQIHILLGDGKGRFFPAENLKLERGYPFGLSVHSFQTNSPTGDTNGYWPVYLNAADFNGDSKPDLLVRLDREQRGSGTNFFSTLYNTTKPYPRFGPLSFSNQGAQMFFFGTPGRTYTFEVSSNLLTWDGISTLTNQTGTLHFTDPAATNSTQRFYRARKVD